jgi:hypothetical protein
MEVGGVDKFCLSRSGLRWFIYPLHLSQNCISGAGPDYMLLSRALLSSQVIYMPVALRAWVINVTTHPVLSERLSAWKSWTVKTALHSEWGRGA